MNTTVRCTDAGCRSGYGGHRIAERDASHRTGRADRADHARADRAAVRAGHIRASIEDDTEPTTNESASETSRHSRRHVQRSLHHLDRLVRHAIHDALMEAPDLDGETVAAVRELAKEFRMDLRDAFHVAGRGADFDRSALLEGLGEAITKLTEGLRALRGEESDTEETPPDEPTPVEPAKPVPDDDVPPGGLLHTYA